MITITPTQKKQGTLKRNSCSFKSLTSEDINQVGVTITCPDIKDLKEQEQLVKGEFCGFVSVRRQVCPVGSKGDLTQMWSGLNPQKPHTIAICRGPKCTEFSISLLYSPFLKAESELQL